VATAQGVPITLALVVAAPLCWGVIAAKPPRLARFQLSGMRPCQGGASPKVVKSEKRAQRSEGRNTLEYVSSIALAKEE